MLLEEAATAAISSFASSGFRSAPVFQPDSAASNPYIQDALSLPACAKRNATTDHYPAVIAKEGLRVYLAATQNRASRQARHCPRRSGCLHACGTWGSRSFSFKT